MKTLKVFHTVALVSACSLCSGVVLAAEGVSPLQPGATTGNHAGALPPAGVYFSIDTDYEWGKLKNGDGDTAVTPAGAKIKTRNSSTVAALTWATDYTLLGARYAMAVAQPYKWAHTDFDSSSSSTDVDSDGLINTAITPAILSWDLSHGYFVSAGLTVYLNDGYFTSAYDSTEGRNVKSSSAIGNHYWTFEPSIAFSYLGETWSFTANNTFDINTENHETHYQSGNTYYLDLTLTRDYKKFTYGVIGNVTKQFTDDEVFGQTVAAVDGMYSAGNRAEHVLAGGMLAYHFDSFTVSSRLLMSLQAKNDANVSFLHVGLSFPIQ